METQNFMNALSAEDLKNVNGGSIWNHEFIDHIHVMLPEPGTCSCVPVRPGFFANELLMSIH